jgi:hypothetical protein
LDIINLGRLFCTPRASDVARLFADILRVWRR